MSNKHYYPHSSSIQSSEHFPETKEMHITFASGGTHCFSDCSEEVHEDLKKAESPGKFFHLNIRKKFNSRKVD